MNRQRSAQHLPVKSADARSRRGGRRVVGVLAVGIVLTLAASLTAAPNFSPYSDFQAMTVKGLETLQAELAPQGPREDLLHSVTFTSTVNTLDVSKLVPFRRSGFSYTSGPGVTFKATPQELKAMIDNVATLPNVTAGGVAVSRRVSFTLVNQGKGFEAIVNKADGAALFEKLRESFANNKEALLALNTLACPLGLTESGTPTDVGASASVDFSGIRLVRSTGRFVGTATVKNNSANTFAAPVSVVVIAKNNVELANADGTTCFASPIGAPFVNLPGALAPGQSASVTVEFRNPDRLAVAPTTKVLAGAGAR